MSTETNTNNKELKTERSRSQSQQVPSLRFKEFDGNWKSSKMDDHFEFKNGLNKEKEYFGKGTPIINFTDAYHLSGITKADIKGLVELNKSEIERYSAKKGDVFFTRTSETIHDIGMAAALIEDIPDCVFSGFVLRARPINNEISDDFKKYCFEVWPVRKEIVTKSSFTTRALTSGTLLNKVVLKFPKSLTEQQKIASFLTAVDKKIQQLTHKKELLEQYKKGVMQKLFPSTGSGQSPEIRFKIPNADGELVEPPDWKEKRLGEIMKERNIKAPKSDRYPLMAFIKYKGVAPKGDRYNREFLVNDGDNKKYKLTEFGDFIYSSNNLETGSIGLNRYGSASISPVYSIFQIGELCNYQFISSFLLRKSFINKMIRFRQGVVYGQWRIHESDFLKIKEMIPSLKEQQKIADYLSAIDTKIESVNIQIIQTQNFKKGLLQQMFV